MIKKAASVLLSIGILAATLLMPDSLISAKAETYINNASLMPKYIPDSEVQLDAEGTPVSEDLYGLFLEDISFAGDGGLVSNLVANGSFEYEALPLSNWFITNLSATVGSEEGLNEKNAPCAKSA